MAIGNFLLEKNNQSKEFGFDFSSYMGKELLLHEIQILKDNTQAGVIIFLFNGNDIVGFWQDKSNENHDIDKLINAGLITIKQN